MGLQEGNRGGIRSLLRRKQVDSDRGRSGGSSQHQLAKDLSILQLIAVGVGSTIGAGVYVLVGTVAREHAGPALTISFLIAGIAAALSAFCYAELASRCPSAGSAYHYSYICIGESVAWLIGWALILEYTIGGSAVARGISPNLALFFGGPDSLPIFLARAYIPGTDIVVDPCAAFLVLIVTGLLCVGIKESTFVQGIITTANVFVMLFVIIAGGYIGFQTGWVGYKVSEGYFPYGVNGILAGSATVFFAYIGFDSVASTAEEVKNPQRDLPWGIGLSLSLCCLLYMLVSAVIVGLVPYFAMDPDTPISSAFSRNGMQWAMYIITGGAVLALCSSLMGSILPQGHTLGSIYTLPRFASRVGKILDSFSTLWTLSGCIPPRILMAMARDGLLPPFFSDVNKHTQVPVKSTILTGICAAALAFLMDVDQLAGMVSVGTLLAFTIVAISILILRYVPPDEIPLPSSFQESIDSVALRYNIQENNLETTKDLVETSIIWEAGPFIVKENNQDNMNEKTRRKYATWSIASVCIGGFLLASSATATFFPVFLRYSACSIGGLLFLCGLVVLSCIDQDDARHSFGHAGGFICPFVPLLPVCCILINIYLLINLGAGTWIRVSVWLVIGVLVYLFYGRTHSSLIDVVYVPAMHADEIYKTSSECVS